jgi:hypothetical protein
VVEQRRERTSLQGVLGYLNFSEGRPDPRVVRQIDDAYASLTEQGVAEPWAVLHDWLRTELVALKSAGGAFQNTIQAEAVLNLAFRHVLPEYRRFHAELLFHQSERDLFQAYFLARVLEAVLVQGGPWDQERRIVAGALRQLNDFAGHRPVAILETRPRGEPYEHEKVRPIPLFMRGAGVAYGRYHDLIARGLELLAESDRDLLAEAGFDPQLLDELALDPRAFDFAHPVNRRPNYAFGEWDPSHLDNKGHYRRYVARQITLDALLDRVAHPGPLERPEALIEAAAVFSGTLLMATAMSGNGPSAYDSATTLATLVPRIARLRDAFYTQLLGRLGDRGSHGARLRQEASALRQPFGGARQHLNAYLARQRALQLQQRHLSLLFADMGYPEAAREETARIPAASARMMSEVHGRMTAGALMVERGQLPEAARLLPEVEDLLLRGIECGALVDPWNILGFQGLFPIFNSREDAVRDQRVHELVGAVERLLTLHARVMSEAAAHGDAALVSSVSTGMKQLAGWWDRFATAGVSEVRPVHGGEAVASAGQVAEALAHWHDRGQASADLAFWREHLLGFRSPKAFALVVEALLRKSDYRAAMGLLVNWASQAEQIPLENGEHSFHALALQWILAVTSVADGGGRVAGEEPSSATTQHPPLVTESWPLVRRFIDHLEANAEEFWQVPVLEVGRQVETESDEDEDLFGAAYEGVTYQDTTDDSEGSVAGDGGERDDFDLEAEGERLLHRLHFLTTVARLWHIGARRHPEAEPTSERDEVLARWLTAARENQGRLLALMDAIHMHPVPQPAGAFDSLVEFDRRRLLKEQLLHAVIGTCLETELAVGALEGSLHGDGREPPVSPTGSPYSAPWGPLAIRLERAIQQRDPEAVRQVLPTFLRVFREEPLLFTSLSEGGDPRRVLRARLAQSVVRALAMVLPRLGLLRETYHVLKTARGMELAHPPKGRGVTEFNELFQTAYRGAVECVVASSAAWESPQNSDETLVDLLDTLTTPFLGLWIDHARSLQLSTLETVRDDDEWDALDDFVKRYGRDLFDTRFLTLGNLRGILHRGVGGWLEYLRENPDPLHPIRLIDDLDRDISREVAIARLQVILQAIVENYEEYKDFNATTTQSDDGGSLYILLDFLRLKTTYERHAWHFRPVALAHDVLARAGRTEAAVGWEEAFAQLVQEPAAEHLDELARLEREHRVRLSTVADRLKEGFVKPLALDRLSALIEPAVREARQPGSRLAFERLRRELHAFAATPTGAGLDLPHWLRRLEGEVQRVRQTHSAVALLADGLFRTPQRAVPYEEVQRQLQEFERQPEES